MAIASKSTQKVPPTESLSVRKARAEREIARQIDELSIGITPKREAMLNAYVRLKSEKLDR